MYLTETHIIRKEHKYYEECDRLCLESRRVYEYCLGIARDDYFQNKIYMGIKKLYYATTRHELWRQIQLPRKVCEGAITHVDQNFKKFFSRLKNNKNKFRRINPPNHSQSEKLFITYNKMNINFRFYPLTGEVRLSQTNIYIRLIKATKETVKQVRILPRNNHFVIEVVYEQECLPERTDGIISALDLGINNLVTVAFSDGKEPFIINGRPLKSINQYYNKKLAFLRSRLADEQWTSKNIKKLTHKHNNKINDYIHKASHALAEELLKREVRLLIIGHNSNWKRSINIGRQNNQNFHQIPHTKLIKKIRYKCELRGIKVLIQEESYTSKCSFLDLEEIVKHDIYLGKRIKRGMFKSYLGKLINADLNAAYNIMRKALPDAYTSKGIEDFVVHPKYLYLN